MHYEETNAELQYRRRLGTIWLVISIGFWIISIGGIIYKIRTGI
ncbi:MAG TPA: hypothetical protein VMX97_08950 [Hyphomicrobiaceae bacterium]|nr:hypothetical protein [Hyphomicrobiaceae bacterium]